MGSIVELVREVMALTTTVGGLHDDVKILTGKLEEHSERIIRLEVRLEEREAVLCEKVTATAMKFVAEFTATRLGSTHVGVEENTLDERSGTLLALKKQS